LKKRKIEEQPITQILRRDLPRPSGLKGVERLRKVGRVLRRVGRVVIGVRGERTVFD
jgi:hypothetical protein